MGNIRYQRTAHRITSAVNCRPLKPSPRSICPAAPYPTGVHIPGIPPPAKFATGPPPLVWHERQVDQADAGAIVASPFIAHHGKPWVPVCSMVEQKADRLLDGAVLRGRNGFRIFEKADESGALTLVEAA